jgi:hypothetical protein
MRLADLSSGCGVHCNKFIEARTMCVAHAKGQSQTGRSVDATPITSLGELIDSVTPHAPDPLTARWRTGYVYHGARDAYSPLLTSLDRLGGSCPPHSKAHLEGHILRHFLRYARPYFPGAPPNEWELLVTAQHHGVPTRLFDWSYSPLIAAHFATRVHEQARDAAIWQLNWRQVHAAFGLPDLALLITDMDRLFGDGRDFTPWQLFDGRHKPFACLLEPPALDARLVAQSAVFTLCSETRNSLDGFLAKNHLDAALTRFIIPAAALPRLRDQLDLVGIDERRLFPDLDGLAAETRRYYT